ncbi:unnamed protein product, partial [Didymodactylos carnosus]
MERTQSDYHQRGEEDVGLETICAELLKSDRVVHGYSDFEFLFSSSEYPRLLDERIFPRLLDNQKFEIEWPRKIPPQLSLLMLGVPSGTNIDELRQDVQRIYPSIVTAASQPTYKSITSVHVRLDFRNSTEYDRCKEI